MAALVVFAALLAAAQALAFGWVRWPLSASFGFVPGDDFDMQLSLLEAIGRCWRAGVLPGWNPWTAGGVPLLANPEAPVFHPLGLLAAFVPAETLLRLSVGAHWCVAFAGTGLLAQQLARQAGAGRGSASLTGIVSMVGLASTDVLVSRAAAGHATMLQAAWIPMALWLAGRPTAWPAALAISAALYGGGPQVAFFAALAVGLRMALDGLQDRSRWLALLGVGGLTALLALPRLVTTALAMDGLDRFVWPTPTGALVAPTLGEALARVGFGGTLAPRPEGGHNGLPALLLPLWPALAALGAWVLRRRPAAPVALGLLFLLSLGDLSPVPLYRWMHALPPLDRLRFPDRLALAWVPLLCAVGGVGAMLWIRHWLSQAVVALGLVSFTLWAAGQHRAPWQIDPGRPVVVSAAHAPPPPVEEPLAAPTFVEGRPRTNLHAVRSNASCLGCQDATEAAARPGRAVGPYPLRGGVTLVAWSPGRIDLEVGVAGPLPLPESARPGWRATDPQGREVLLSKADDGSLVVHPDRPGRVRLRYTPPGLWAALGGTLGGLILLVWWRSRSPRLA